MSAAVLFDEDLGYLVGLRRIRPPIASMPGTEVFPGSTWLEWLRLELRSDEPGTPERQAWLARAAKRHGVT